MQTILIPTDFSATATHAAEYAYRIAQQINANVVLCNALTVSAEIPQTGMSVWPMEEYDAQIRESEKELSLLKKHLIATPLIQEVQPLVMCKNESGILTDVVNGIIASQPVGLVVIGTHRKGGIGQFLLGNHTRNMIDGIAKPLMIIPAEAPITIPKKIAFATDFKNEEDDLDTLFWLVPLANSLQAEILITHICSEEAHTPELEARIKEFMVKVSNKANYSNIFYRKVTHDQTAKGLDWLCENGEVDMLAMVHRSRNFFENLFKGSHTQKMASRTLIPLLVLPGSW